MFIFWSIMNFSLFSGLAIADITHLACEQALSPDQYVS
jgi:hypothetical protein